MDEKGNKLVQYLIAYSVSLVTVAMGAFSSWPAPVMPKFRNNETEFRITDDELAWMVSMTSPGFMTGSLLCRVLADRFGRRTTILLTVIPFLTGTLIVAFAVKAWLLYLTRFIWGCGSGMIGSVSTLYMAEIADKQIRGSLTLVLRFMFNFGNLLMMCIGPFVSYKTLNFLLLIIPLGFFFACWWIPESPYFCLKEGKVNEARKVLKRIRIYKDEKAMEDDLMEMKADVKKDMKDASTAKELFSSRKYRKAVIISTEQGAYVSAMKKSLKSWKWLKPKDELEYKWNEIKGSINAQKALKLTQILTGQLILQQYLGLIMLESGTKINLSLIFIIFGVLRFISGVASSMIADKVGRRPLLVYSYLGTGLSLAIAGLYFFLLEVIQVDRETLSPFSFMPFAGIIASNIISTLGYYSVIVLVPAEIFPLNVKAIAMTSICIFGGLLNFCLARGYQSLKDVSGLCGVFWFLATSAVAGCVFSILYIPETKGKSLKEIQVLLQGDMYETGDVVTINQRDYDVNVEKDESRELLDLKNGVCVSKIL